MKKILTRSIFIAIFFLAINFAVVYGATKTSGIYTYTDIKDGTIRLDSYSANVPNVVIPSTIDGKVLSIIGTNAFKNKTAIKTIELPNTVTTIEAYAFNSCANLTTVYMPVSLRYINHVFYKSCPKITYKIPDHLTKMVDGSYIKVETVTIHGSYNYDSVNEVYKLVNAERAKLGLPAYEFSADLTAAAMKRAAETAVYWDHERPNSLSCFSVLDLIDGENIGVGSSSTTIIMNKWMKSAGHKAQIISSKYKSIGIGCYKANGISFWVQLFSKEGTTNSKVITGRKDNVENKVQVATDIDRLDVTITGLSENMNLEIGQTVSPTKAVIVNKAYTAVKTQIELSDITWTSSDESVFTVDKNGTITVVGGGRATLTAKLGESVHTYNITVNSPLVSISIPDVATVFTGYTTNLSVTYNPKNTTDDKTVVWSSSDEKIATVNNQGIVTGVNEGVVKITAKVGDKVDTCMVTVKKAVTENIYFSNTEETILVSTETTTLDLVFEPGTNTKDDKIIWQSSDENIAVVDQNGVVKVLGTGKVTIVAKTAIGNIAQCELNIVDYKLGDLDGDNKITANDAAMVLDIYKNNNATANDLKIGDLDGDNKITANDAAMILDMYKRGV